MRNNQSFPVVITVALFALIATYGVSQETVSVNAPDGSVTATVGLNDSGRPMLLARLNNQPALKPSKLGITVDGTDLGDGVTPVDTSPYTVNERYAWRGGKSQAHNHANGRKIRFRHTDSGQEWILDVRVYDTGVGWRYIVPGNGTRRVNGETSTFNLPSGTELWYQDDVPTYENNFQSVTLTEGNPGNTPNRVGPPATGILPGGGYVTLAESDVLGYSGMSLVAADATAFSVQFHNNPDGWTVDGRIESPWRVAFVAGDLNELVSSNLVNHLAPAPDEELFPEGVETDWLRSGRSWWTWFVDGDPGAHWDRQKRYVDRAARLNCQFHLIDAGWEGGYGWLEGQRSKWDRLNELTDYAAKKNVGIWVWTAGFEGGGGKASPGLETRKKRKRFFGHLAEADVVGVKVDYFNSESHRTLEVMEGILRQAARHEIMINFHGTYPPAGEARTWPNEMTREGVRAMEYNNLAGKLGYSRLEHWTALPFTRFVVGHGDITPGVIPEKYLKNLTATSQLAMATIYTSPVLCWAGTYELFKNSGVTDVLRHLPTTWDETRVLPSSKIGRRAVMARRTGKTWYVAGLFGAGDHGKTLYESDVITGKQGPETIRVSLPEAKYLVLRTDPAGDGNNYDHTNWANATLETADGKRVRLSQLKPVQSSQGWGSLKMDNSITGTPLQIDGETFNHGLGTHAESTVVYELDQRYDTFRATIGIDEEAGEQGSAKFSVHTRSDQKQMSPDLSFLTADRYSARIVHEGEKASSFYTRTKQGVDAETTLTVPIRPGGGFLVILRPE